MDAIDEPRPRRGWTAPAAVLGVVAVVVVVLVVGLVMVRSGGDGDDADDLPAVTSPPPTAVTTAPTTTAEATVPTTSTPPTEPPATTATTEPGPAVTVSEVGWDGDGSACVTVAGVTGCFPAGTIGTAPAGGTNAHVFTDTGDVSLTLTSTGADVVAEATDAGTPCPEMPAYRRDTVLVGLTCGQGASALWSALPAVPGGAIADEAVRYQNGAIVPLTRLDTRTDVRAFLTDVDVGGIVLRCTLVAPDTSGWYESCSVPSDPAHPGTLFVAHQGSLWQLDPTNGRIAALAQAPVRTNGCDLPAADVAGVALGQPVMLGYLACRGDVATGSFASVFVQQGPPDGGLVVWERDDTGVWTLTDSGTGIEPDPLPLPLPPIDLVLLDARTAATGFEDVTETVRGWMQARPELTIADAIAAGEGEVTSVSTLPTEGMVPLPSLTVVDVTYPDDSVTGARYAVWTTEPDDGSDPLLVAHRWLICGRGIAEGTDPPLCL